MFNATYNQFLSYVTAQSITNTTQSQDAANIQQIIYQKLWRVITKARRGINQKWITITTRNTIADYNNKNNSYQQSITTADLETKYPAQSLRENPVQLLNYKQQLTRIHKAEKRNLTKSQIQIINLYTKGYRYQEIANELKLTRGQVSGRIQRARAKLRADQHKGELQNGN